LKLKKINRFSLRRFVYTDHIDNDLATNYCFLGSLGFSKPCVTLNIWSIGQEKGSFARPFQPTAHCGITFIAFNNNFAFEKFIEIADLLVNVCYYGSSCCLG
jgi:hypothetical protein